MLTIAESAYKILNATHAVVLPFHPHDEFWSMWYTLNGEKFFFRFMYNYREEKWYMSIYDAANDLLASGIKMVNNWSLLSKYADPRMPKGELWTVDVSGGYAEPERYDMGDRVKLVFYWEE